MLDAFRPVVLAPAGAAGAGAGGAVAGAAPLVRFSLVRSYANARSPGLASGATADGRGPRARMSLDGGSLDEGPADAGALYGGPSGRGGGAGGPRGGAGSAEAGGPAPEAGPGEIWSFRSATLDVGALDVQARPPAAPSVPPVSELAGCSALPVMLHGSFTWERIAARFTACDCLWRRKEYICRILHGNGYFTHPILLIT